jgi:chorismate mutase
MRAELQKRIEELSREIRNYPTPIARCDLHLPALIEERAELMRKLEALNEQGSCSPDALWTNDGGLQA